MILEWCVFSRHSENIVKSLVGCIDCPDSRFPMIKRRVSIVTVKGVRSLPQENNEPCEVSNMWRLESRTKKEGG